jgi:hypothetical protein
VKGWGRVEGGNRRGAYEFVICQKFCKGDGIGRVSRTDGKVGMLSKWWTKDVKEREKDVLEDVGLI